MATQDFKTRTLKTPEGKEIIYFDGKLHSWDFPALKYPKGSKQKDEYYIYGRQYSKEEWLEARRDRNGVPPEKNPQVTSRF